MRPLVSIVLMSTSAFAGAGGVQTHTLANGMKILVQEDHNIPNVAMYFFYKIGSRNERPGTTGISHFFEHMMFNGAKKYGPKQFDVQMEKNGGNNNAYTSEDVTVYTDWFPSAALPLMFDMEADRIRDLSFDPKTIESERGVVYSETAHIGRQQQFRPAVGAAPGRGLHRAPLPLARRGLAVGHRVLDDAGPQEPFPHGIRAE